MGRAEREMESYEPALSMLEKAGNLEDQAVVRREMKVTLSMLRGLETSELEAPAH